MHPRDPDDDTEAGLAFIQGHGLEAGYIDYDARDRGHRWADEAGELDHQQWPEDEKADDE